MNKLITKISLFLTMSMSVINVQYAQASPDLTRCFSERVQFNILANAQTEQSDYYLVDLIPAPSASYTNVIKIELSGTCSVVVDQEQMFFYPLSNFLGKELAYALLTSKYSRLIQQYGGTDALADALLDELEADAPHIFFIDTVEVLKELGIDLKALDPSLFIVGAEGIQAHPELNLE